MFAPKPLLAACALLVAACDRGAPAPARRTWTFPLGDARRVVVKSWRAQEIRISPAAANAGTLQLTARPVLQGTAKHAREPDWRNTPGEQWPFAWKTRRNRDALELSSTGECRFPHHRYLLEELTITVPAGVAVEGRRQPLEARSAGP